jgi:purine-binding chemotaxis protein CheW
MTTETETAKSGTMQSHGRFSTFYVADLLFGVDVLRVQEVLRYQPMTRVPKAPGVIEGLMNLRGQIVTAIDMRRLLHLPEREVAAQPMNVVIRTEAGAVSLLVDEIGDVLDLEDAAYEAPPGNLDVAARRLLVGVVKLERQLLLVLDPEQAIDIAVR